MWKKYIQWITTLSLTIRVSSSALRLLPPKSAKSREIRWKFELIADQFIQGQQATNLGANGKRIYNFLFVINSRPNFGRISFRFRDIDAFNSKTAFSPPHSCLTPPSGGTPCDINAIYTVRQKIHPCSFCNNLIKLRYLVCQFCACNYLNEFLTKRCKHFTFATKYFLQNEIQ